MKIGDKVKITINIGNKPYFFRGLVVLIEEEYLTLNDIKIGITRIKRSEIILEEPFEVSR